MVALSFCCVMQKNAKTPITIWHLKRRVLYLFLT